MEDDSTNGVADKMLHLMVKEDKVEEEFEKDFGSRLRIVKWASIIQETGNRLHCSNITITKAQVFFHRVLRSRKEAKGDRLSLATACLSLSIKLDNEDVSTEDVLLKFYNVSQDLENIPNFSRRNPSNELFKEMKKTLSMVEHAVLRELNFEIVCPIAHVYVYKFLAQLHSITDVSDVIIISMASTATKLLSTYYLCEGCVDWNAHEIAVACLQFLYLYCGIICSPIKYLMRKELNSYENKDRISEILNELIITSDVSTTLKHI